jgi:hypothetical protein
MGTVAAASTPIAQTDPEVTGSPAQPVHGATPARHDSGTVGIPTPKSSLEWHQLAQRTR